jgi:hypothetical protein
MDYEIDTQTEILFPFVIKFINWRWLWIQMSWEISALYSADVCNLSVSQTVGYSTKIKMNKKSER